MPKFYSSNLQNKKKFCVWQANEYVLFIARFSLFSTEQQKSMFIQTGFIFIGLFTATPKQVRGERLLQFVMETASDSALKPETIA